MNVIIKAKNDVDCIPMTCYLDGYLNASISLRGIPAYVLLSINSDEIRVVFDEEEDINAREVVTFIGDIAMQIKAFDGYEMVIEAK